MTQKLYPFSLRRYAHDLAFRRNRAKNEMSDKECEGILTAHERAQYERLINDLGDILCTYPDNRGIVWLTGKQWALANESSAWACAMRG